MSPTLFTFRLASGEVVTTHVHGDGGAISGSGQASAQLVNFEEATCKNRKIAGVVAARSAVSSRTGAGNAATFSVITAVMDPMRRCSAASAANLLTQMVNFDHYPISVRGIGFLRIQIRRANEGRPLRRYEPIPGHVRAYRQTAKADVDERVLDLRGAEILEVVG